MVQKKNPRHGSMQYWPRKRAKRVLARVRHWPLQNEPNLSGFIAYKVGMCHVMAKDISKLSLTKGETLSVPTTILECPPVRIAAARIYSFDELGNRIVSEDIVLSSDKIIKNAGFKPTSKPSLSSNLQKLKQLSSDSQNVAEIRVVIFSNAQKGFLSRKNPLFLETAIAKDVQSAIDFISNNLDKDIRISDVFKEGTYVDVRGITKGKGFSGPVKRFGISLRSHKSEKTKRGPGSLGPWTARNAVMYRVAHAGQLGFFQRTEYNKAVLKIGSDAQQINRKGGFHKYGIVKHDYILLKGSVQGSAKRPIVLSVPVRAPSKKPNLEVKEIIL